jgi:hypothetical protein
MTGLTAGIPQRINKPRCQGCSKGGIAHPYPKPNATERQLNGSVPGGYDWLCSDCAYLRENPGAPELRPLPREREIPLQRERLFDV